LYPPTRSELGQYDVGVAERLDQPLAMGAATLQNGIVVLEVRIDFADLHPGLCSLALRQRDRTRNPHRALLK
jgi:hypothetical protein